MIELVNRHRILSWPVTWRYEIHPESVQGQKNVMLVFYPLDWTPT
jgi:peroxiredoxin